MNKQIEEMAKAKKCNTCIHNAVCEKLEEFRDPLGWVDTEGEFGCSYYEKSTDVAREIVDLLREIQNDLQARDEFREASAIRYAIGQVEYYAEKKYESEGADDEISREG